MRPFIKWAGGKSQLIERLVSMMPCSYDTYFEPFIGGGALFLHLKPKKAVINDINEQLINVYRQLQLNATEVINILNDLDKRLCDKDFYYEIRDKFNNKISSNEIDEEAAALFIWVNKHCFNGLYRVNKRGLFNVPYNNKVSGRSFDENNLLKIGSYLQEADVKICCGDFQTVCKDAKECDFVYFDSPYVPINPDSFTKYTKDDFTLEDHERLSMLFKHLNNKNIKVMLSNHDTALVRNLYDGFNTDVVDVRRSINSDARKRSGREVIIKNF